MCDPAGRLDGFLGRGSEEPAGYKLDVNIMKEDVDNIHVWVRFHDVPITSFTEDGLSAIATKLGNPLMLNSYTTAMCTDSWGRASFARAMIELKADVEFRDTIVVFVPIFSGERFNTSSIRVEYEWTPPRCSEFKIFGHVLDDCHKKIVSNILKNPKMSHQPARGPSVGLKPKSTSVAPLPPGSGGGNQTPSTNATPAVAGINELERKMLDGKLVLVDDHGKPLEMKFPNDETSRYMSSTGEGGFYEDDLDLYDGYEAQVYDLREQMRTFCDQFDIRFRSRVRK
ncbi:RNA-directed DNA polymerase, eukaryota [Tanacetum coccineum]